MYTTVSRNNPNLPRRAQQPSFNRNTALRSNINPQRRQRAQSAAPMYRTYNPPREMVEQRESRSRSPRPVAASDVRIVSKPLAAAVSTVTTQQSYHTVVARSEMCYKVSMDADLNHLTDHPVNPANDSLFPWLSKIAPYFEFYEFEKLQFRYVPSCGTQTQGQLTLAIDYDPVDLNIGIDEQILSAMAGSVATQLFTPATLLFNKSALAQTTHKFYTSQDDDYEEGARLKHIGRLLTYITTSVQEKTTFGTLYVDYVVRFTNAQDAGPGFSNNAVVSTSQGGATQNDPLGDVVNSNVISTKPNTTASKSKTKRVVKIINGIMTVVAKVAPYISFVAKLFLADYCPPLPGHYWDALNVEHALALADVPGESVAILKSTQCRKGTILCHLYGTFTVLQNGHYPMIFMTCSTNLTLTSKITWPYNAVSSAYLIGPIVTSITYVGEFEFNNFDTDTAWLKPVVMDVNSNSTGWVSIASNTANYLNVFTKQDLDGS